MRAVLGFLLALFTAAACAQTLQVPLPAGCVPSLQGSVVVCGSGPGPRPPPTCANFSRTIVLSVAWPLPATVLTGAMGPNDVAVVTFTTGAVASPNAYGNIVGAEYQSPPSQRVFALSTLPCDFSAGLAAGAAGTSNTATVNFTVGANGSGYYPALQPNTAYYLNVSNAHGSTCSTAGICNMYFQLHKPAGT